MEYKTERIIQTKEEVSLEIKGITLLSADEFMKCDKDHVKRYVPYWLSTSFFGIKSFAAFVNIDGALDYMHVNHEFGVVPALEIESMPPDINIGNQFSLKNHLWTVVTKNRALCNESIAAFPFRREWDAPDANDYDKSDIRKFLLDWWDGNKNP